MLDLDIFSRFETFPLPASLILSLFLIQFLPHLLLLRALFLHPLFRLRAHFFARLPSLFAFACWQRNFGVPGYVNFCATRSAMKAATNNKLRYSDKHFNNNNNSSNGSSRRIHSGRISPCPHDANFYNFRQRKLFSCHFCSNRNEFAETLKWFSDWTALKLDLLLPQLGECVRRRTEPTGYLTQQIKRVFPVRKQTAIR